MHALPRILQRHRRLASVSLCLILTTLGLWPVLSNAMLRLDFEQTFFVLPGHNIWDFCIVEQEGLFHIYYIDVLEDSPSANDSNQLGHASSSDLIHWDVHAPAITVGPGWWEGESVWAPHVVRDTVQERWVMAYTGVDSLRVQRACIAYSTDLFNWTKEATNPVFEPDTLTYFWSPTLEWSSFRDPFLYFDGAQWNMLSTAQIRFGGYPGVKRGAVHRATSVDFIHWGDAGTVFVHDGDVKWHDIESVHYVQRQGLHHLFYTEFGVEGVSHMASPTFGTWTMAGKTTLDESAAPEILTYPGGDILGRYTTWQHVADGSFSFCLRFDTLQWVTPDVPAILKPNPLERDWVVASGTATLGNPVFGDNPGERGEPSPGHQGNFWFGSQEYYRGPLHGVGSPGARLGDFATGTLESRPFTITGDVIRLLVGGGYYPATCYVALVDAVEDTVLHSATGNGTPLMSMRQWPVSDSFGLSALIRIIDLEGGPMGYITVDEIVEIDAVSAVELPRSPVDVRAAPNPFNPQTEFRFQLAGEATTRLMIHDARGRCIWTTESETLGAGSRSILWDGRNDDGRNAPSGSYFYRLLLDGQVASHGQVTLLR